MTAKLRPTFKGWVRDTREALSLIQGVIDGILEPVSRRPKDIERLELIRSGTIIIYSEEESGIKRWTDGVTWSPSRILNHFLIYREINRDNSGDRRSHSRHRRRRSNLNTPYSRPESLHSPVRASAETGSMDMSGASGGYLTSQGNRTAHNEASVYGSLVDSYDFKEHGLVKKTFTVKYRENKTYHLISYYSAEDIDNNLLVLPASRPELRDIEIDQEMLQSRQYRTPLDTIDVLHAQEDHGMVYPQGPEATYGGYIHSHPREDYGPPRGWPYLEHRPLSAGAGEYDSAPPPGFLPAVPPRRGNWYPGPQIPGPNPNPAPPQDFYDVSGGGGIPPPVPPTLGLEHLDMGLSYSMGPAQNTSSHTPRSMQPPGYGQGYARSMGHHAGGSLGGMPGMNPYNQPQAQAQYQYQDRASRPYPPPREPKREGGGDNPEGGRDPNDFDFPY